MTAEIIGFRGYDFTDKDGRQVSGTSLFVAFEEEGVTGRAAERLSVNSAIALPSGIKPGDKININFNRRGKVDKIEKADKLSPSTI